MSEKVETQQSREQATMAKGLAWLTAGNILSRLLGVAYVIPWYIWLGEYRAEANALFSMGYQIYANFLLISTVGLPTAIAKQVAKYNVLGKENVSLYLVREFFKIMLVFGAVFAGAMYISSPWLAEASGSKEKLIPVMYSLVPPLFIFPAMSILRGFFQGRHDMKPYAISQLAEQLVRVIWILAATFTIMKLGDGNYLNAVVQSTFAAFVGMIASVVILVYTLWKQGYLCKLIHAKKQKISINTGQLIKETVRDAVPIIILSLTIQLLQFIDQVTFIKVMEQITTYTNSELLELYSYMAANPNKITMMIIGISQSLGSVAIPLITEKFVQKDLKSASNLVADNLQLLFIFTIPAIVGTVLLARPLYSVFYGPSEEIAIGLFIWNLFLILPLGLYSVISVVIQAIFENRKGIYYFLIGILVKLVLQVPMIYVFKVYGSFISTILGLGIMLYLFYRRIDTVLGIDEKLVVKDVVTISWISLAMGIIVWFVEFLLNLLFPANGYLSSFIHLAISGSAGLLIFVILTLKTHQLDRLIGGRAQVLRRKLRLV
ncbi:putative polysaccharide biosynthesis protein [Streptococcus ruminantium]|uniref:Polysaccharide biosynthesis protein n=1 Tax=Streptococcus ruminantium TaxID=1917441 RepID=A0ABU1B4U9_9STRE|nr:polysaccharide biosynthesis protein [Streptococcus ruminantium]MDQ8759823.1 polysaccharide biosynthesis protein [Streptococcus ruminantium]MDQ8765907.1 polysaccharide biosynthesis protein [Streptococcus ruminantium]MDQ8767750.1 polysaccharide biosynthesis protein [Streptococcus ruminantium]MDQ8768862.1 polysaccharide biosynthesis protein [Streptococcus ruminantium]MDQ8774800.1 polysaccharide biosynthesis protein [Streptococcus ruminantium]